MEPDTDSKFVVLSQSVIGSAANSAGDQIPAVTTKQKEFLGIH